MAKETKPTKGAAIKTGNPKNAKPAEVYAMNGTSVKDGESPFETYVTEKSAREADLTDPVPNGVSYATAKKRSAGVETRGNGAAERGRKAYGPLA